MCFRLIIRVSAFSTCRSLPDRLHGMQIFDLRPTRNMAADPGNSRAKQSFDDIREYIGETADIK